jgi:deoxyadenosine/deoxycytidine kinase
MGGNNVKSGSSVGLAKRLKYRLNTRKMSKIWVSFEGGISEGKTTLLNKMSSPDVCIAYEPVEEWEKSGMLKMSYEDPAFIFPAQCDFFDSRITVFNTIYNANCDAKFIFSERCPFSDKVFWTMRYKRDNMDKRLFDLYNRMWSQWQKLLPVRQPNLFVYLRASSTDICWERKKERNRSAENSLTYEYMAAIRKEHDAIFMHDYVEMPDGARVPVLVVNTDDNYRDDPQVLARISAQIWDRIKGL